MSAPDGSSGIRAIAGRRAREEAAVLDRLVESMRLASFRTYLAATVGSMSKLVPNVLELAGTDVASAMQRLRPSHMWPSVTAREDEYGRTGPATDRMVAIDRDRFSKRPAALIGDTIVSEGLFGPMVELKVYGGSLDIVLRGDGFRLSTMDGTGYVVFDGRLPDTVVGACRGRPLNDVVDHPLLRSRGLVVANAAQVGKETSLSFDVGRAPLEVPWRLWVGKFDRTNRQRPAVSVG